tara:strand:- start:87 stop:257 length:171 start_codon:yes stop_codon:yes gene_type:complete
MGILDKVLCYGKCFGGYAVALFAGWELAKGDWIVALPALAATVYLAWNGRNSTCKL